jgi:hypothetical protein
MHRITPLIAAGACIAAGVYLLSTQAVAENSFLEVLAHGIGIYFIGKGVFIWSTLARQDRMIDLLAEQLEQPRVVVRRREPARDEEATPTDG